MHTPIGQCTSDCRRVGCPEEDLCAYCDTNKWENSEKHIAELAQFLQEKIKEIQNILNDVYETQEQNP